MMPSAVTVGVRYIGALFIVKAKNHQENEENDP
jgi:hypothetical protein